MASSDVQRKLTAILCADVAGYSRLMGADEETTIETLTAYRKVFLSHIETHRGRVVDAKGDAILAEFASVVDAVSSAVDIQKQLAEQNAEFPDDRRMDFRIGINLGDMVVKDDVIYGDGVNVAARLESLAEPGGICISRPVYDQVESKLDLECEYLGEQEVKNISKPVRAYKVLLKSGAEPAPDQGKAVGAAAAGAGVLPFAEGQALPLPDKPSIAVLAFENMSGDPEQGYFSDGISEDIITDLSKISGLFVIARNATFAYKGKAANPQQVGEELGVRYVLEGSVRKAAQRVRITAQLIDARSGDHVWAERFDRDLHDVFAVQDEITSEIVAALDVQVARGERARIWRQALKNPEARDCLYRAAEVFWSNPGGDMAPARHLFDQVIALEPESPVGYAAKAWTYLVESWYQGAARGRIAEEAGVLVEKALALDESLPDARAMQAWVYVQQGDHDRALAEAEQAAVLGPNAVDSLVIAGLVLIYCGEPEQATVLLQRAIRLCPIYEVSWLGIMGAALRTSGRYEEAVAFAREAVRRNPEYKLGYFIQATALCAMERYEEARAVGAELRRMDPKFDLMAWTRALPYKDQSYVERMLADLRKAGLAD